MNNSSSFFFFLNLSESSSSNLSGAFLIFHSCRSFIVSDRIHEMRSVRDSFALSFGEHLGLFTEWNEMGFSSRRGGLLVRGPSIFAVRVKQKLEY